MTVIMSFLSFHNGLVQNIIEKMMTECENMFSSLLNEKAGTVTNLVTT